MQIRKINDHSVVKDVYARVMPPLSAYPWESLDENAGTVTLHSNLKWEYVPKRKVSTIGISLPERKRLWIGEMNLSLPENLRAFFVRDGVVRFESWEPAAGPVTKIQSKVDPAMVVNVLPEFTSSLGWKGNDAVLGITTFYDGSKWEPARNGRWKSVTAGVQRFSKSGLPHNGVWFDECRVQLEFGLKQFTFILHPGMDAKVVDSGTLAFDQEEK